MRRLVMVLVLLAGMVRAGCGQAAVPCVRHYVTYPRLTQYQFDALVDFTFNVGCGAFARSTLLRDVNRGQIAAAAGEFGKWTRAGGRTSTGLVRRRRDERRMFLRSH